MPRQARDDYNAEIDLHDYQKLYEVPPQMPVEEVEAQVVMSMLPTRITNNYLRLTREQTLAAIKLLKSILKPILKSKEFRYSIKSLEMFVLSLRDDPEIKRNLKDAVNTVQAMFQNNNGEFIRELFTWTLAQYVGVVSLLVTILLNKTNALVFRLQCPIRISPL